MSASWGDLLLILLDWAIKWAHEERRRFVFLWHKTYNSFIVINSLTTLYSSSKADLNDYCHLWDAVSIEISIRKFIYLIVFWQLSNEDFNQLSVSESVLYLLVVSKQRINKNIRDYKKWQWQLILKLF